MEKVNLKYIYERTSRLLMKPEKEWDVVADEYYTLKEVFQNYIIPLSVISSLFILLLGFLQYTILQAFGHAIINLLSTTVGTWLSFLITREYLTNKFRDAENIAQNLVVYSSGIFIVFHSMGTAFGNGFFSQLFILLSLIFIRTLYIGINQTAEMQANQKTNILVISALSIICIPVILKHILMIIFGISAFNV